MNFGYLAALGDVTINTTGQGWGIDTSGQGVNINIPGSSGFAPCPSGQKLVCTAGGSCAPGADCSPGLCSCQGGGNTFLWLLGLGAAAAALFAAR